jgi:hypothetical protein
VRSLPPAFPEQPRSRQLAAAIGGPIAFGAVSGLTLGWSAAAYWVWQSVSALGGVAAGFDHRGARPGATRGLLGGLVYASLTLLVRAASSAHDTVDLGSPGVWLVTVLVCGSLLGLAGGLLRRRRDPGDGAPGR